MHLPRGRAFDIHDEMRRITSDVIVRIVFVASDAAPARSPELELVLGAVMQGPPLGLTGDPAIRAMVRNATVGPRGGVRVELAA